MKLNLLSVLLFLALSQIHAQVYSCDSFCVENIYIDTAGQMIVAVHFASDENDIIHYPHIEAVVNQSGDTVATGDLYFFGQVGGTTSEHPAATTLDEIPDGFSAFVTFSFNDTFCILSYPCMTTGIEVVSGQDLLISPNPMITNAIISLDGTMANGSFRLYNLQSMLLREKPFNGSRIYLQRENLISGLYILVIQSGDIILSTKILVADHY